MPDDSLITEQLLRALARKESGNNPAALGDRGLAQPAYGRFQMRRPAYQDVVQRRSEFAGIPFEKVQRDAELQETFARAYLSVLANEYGLSELDDLLAGYNAGPTAVRRGKIPSQTLRYIEDVKRLMQER